SPGLIQRVVLPHSRKRKIDGVWIDPISHPAWAGSRQETSLVLDHTSALDPHPLRGMPSYEVVRAVAAMARPFVQVRLGRVDVARVTALAELPGIGGHGRRYFTAKVMDATRAFLTLRATFSALLRRLGPTHLYLVVSYGNEPAIAAAREVGVESVEFQHGALG